MAAYWRVLKIDPSNPDRAPRVVFNYMSDPQDWKEFRSAVRLTREIFSQNALAEYAGKELSPGKNIQTDNEIDAFVNSKPEQFELIQANEAKDVVYDVIEEHYNETGKILDIEEAAQAVESYLEEEAEKLLSLGKLRSKFNTGDFEQQPQRQSQVTLSNAHSAQANERVGRKLSEEESKREMARMLQWDE